MNNKGVSVQERHSRGWRICQSVKTVSPIAPAMVLLGIHADEPEVGNAHSAMSQQRRTVHNPWANASHRLLCQHSQSCTTSTTQVLKPWPVKEFHHHLITVQPLKVATETSKKLLRRELFHGNSFISFP